MAAAEETRQTPAPKDRAGGPFFNSSLIKRILSALVLMPLALGVVVAGGWVLAGFVGLALCVLVLEWTGIIWAVPATGPADGPCAAPAPATRMVDHAVTGILVLTALSVVGAMALGSGQTALAACLMGGVLAGLLAGFGGRDGFWVLFASAYLMAPALVFLWVREQPDGLAVVIWLFIVVWTTDSGAYLAGRLIGGPAFAPYSSPNKTWAGVIGGVVLATLMGSVAVRFLFPGASGVWTALCWTILVSGATQAGDIFESALKRHFGVKDSGRLIPGHGGLLDRLDGFLFAVIMAGLSLALGRGPG